MIGNIKIHKKKIIITMIIIIAILLLIFPITIIIIFLGGGLQENAIDKKAMEYESEEKRLEYFFENEEYLNKLANYFVEYPELDRIGEEIWCSYVDSPTYEYEEITICVSEKREDLPIEEIANIYKRN